MNQNRRPNVVTVSIAGEEYTLRAMATPEHALRCAALVDDSVRRVLGQSSLIQPQKAAILAALALADELLQLQDDLDRERSESAAFADRLTDEVEQRLSADD
jgi:cell division protein ZapA